MEEELKSKSTPESKSVDFKAPSDDERKTPEQIQDKQDLSVTFDRQKLEDLLSRAPNKAKEVVDSVLKMPEQLEFKTGATLIIGENGAGKSAIAKAIYLAIYAEQERQRGRTGNLEDINKGHPAWDMIVSGGPLVVELSEAIKLNLNADSKFGVEYLDYGRLHGRTAQLMEEQDNENRSGFLGVDKNGYQIGIKGKGASRIPHFDSEPDVVAEEEKNSSLKQHRDKYMSARQSMDDDLTQWRKRIARILELNDEVVTILDEPEVGLGPRRQIAELKKMIMEDAGDRAMAIVPTNSIALYQDNSLPRIDLDHPELGIHYPNQVSTQ